MFHKIIKKYFISFFLLFFLFSCVNSYYSENPKLVETNIVDSWKELKVEVLEIKEDEVTFHLWTEDFEKVQDSLEYEVFYNYLFGREKKYDNVRGQLIVTAIMSTLAGAGSIKLGNEMTGCLDAFSTAWNVENDNSADVMYAMAGVCFVVGAVSLFQGLSLKKKEPQWKIVTRTNKKEENYQNLKSDLVTVSLSNTDFKKDYITDEEGNISVSLEEITPNFLGELSRSNFDFFYKDLVTQITVDFDEIEEEKGKE